MTKQKRLAVLVGGFLAFLILSLGLRLIATHRADRLQDTLFERVETAFRNTTLPQVRQLSIEASRPGGETPARLDSFLEEPGSNPDFFKTNPGGQEGYLAQYSFDYWSFDRCVRVIWTGEGVSFETGEEGGCPKYPEGLD